MYIFVYVWEWDGGVVGRRCHSVCVYVCVCVCVCVLCLHLCVST